jgi:two-component system, NarL family, nitrate/nitrite response regulator NarL
MTAAQQPVRVALVEDHALFAESLEIALTSEGHDVRRIPLPSHSRSVSSLLPAIMRTQARVVLLDLDLGLVGNTLGLIEPIARSGSAVVVVTANRSHARWGECLCHGAKTVLSKNAPLHDVLVTIRRIGNGLSVLDRDMRDHLTRAWHSERHEVQVATARLDLLTTREAEILGQLVEGRQVSEIAKTAVVSEATVRTQVKSILAKLEVSSQIAAVGLAHRAGWHEPGH